MEVAMIGSQTVKLGNFKDTMKMVCLDLVLCSTASYFAAAPASGAAEIACKEQQDFYLAHSGGYMIPIHSKIGQGMRIHLEKLSTSVERTSSFQSISRMMLSISA